MNIETLNLMLGIIQAISSIAVLITVWFLAVQTRADVRSSEEARIVRIADIYQGINDRFDTIVSELPPEINDLPDISELKELAKQPGYESGRAVKAIHRYYYLVRTEFDLCRMGALTDEMWGNWLNGIISSSRFPAFREVWEKDIALSRSRPASVRDTSFEQFMHLVMNDPTTVVKRCSTVADLQEWVRNVS